MGILLTALSGSLVGFSLGLIGGGGSILAVPLLLYVVGVTDVHMAIGTSALAVSANALAALVGHWRRRNVRWSVGAIFALAGVIGASLGSSLGKSIRGPVLLQFFAGLMVVVALAMLRRAPPSRVDLTSDDSGAATRLSVSGLLTGFLSGLFGIGGGFLIVPALIAATNMPILNAIATSLISVTAFGMTTALNYARSDMIRWDTVSYFIGGGIIGSVAGIASAVSLATSRTALTRIFSAAVLIVAVYVFYRGRSGH